MLSPVSFKSFLKVFSKFTFLSGIVYDVFSRKNVTIDYVFTEYQRD